MLVRIVSFILFTTTPLAALTTKLSSGLLASAVKRSITSSHSVMPIFSWPTAVSTAFSVSDLFGVCITRASRLIDKSAAEADSQQQRQSKEQDCILFRFHGSDSSRWGVAPMQALDDYCIGAPVKAYITYRFRASSLNAARTSLTAARSLPAAEPS